MTLRQAQGKLPFATPGFPKLTNEVQHLVKVLSWENIMDMSPLKKGVRLPDYIPWDTQSAKSRQVWIARHRQWLRELKRNGSRTQGYQPRYADQQAGCPGVG